MSKDKKQDDQYPKLGKDDKRWKQQDEFDSGGIQRQLEDEDKNELISRTDESLQDPEKP